MIRPLLPVLVALGLFQTAADPRARLEALEGRRHAEETAAKLLGDEEHSVLDTLAEAEQSIRSSDSECQRVEAERALAKNALARAIDEEAAAKAREDAALLLLRPRLLARARAGNAGPLEAVLSAPSLADLVKRRYLVDRILSRDLALLNDLGLARRDRERARSTKQAETAKLEALAAEAQQRRADLAARREEREALIAALRTARSLHERAAAEIGAQSKKLEELVSTSPPDGFLPRMVSDFAAQKGKLPRPAPGPVTVAFGRVVNPRFNTVTVQNGIDISAKRGTPIRAVAPGRVVYSGWFNGYGNLVIVDQGDGYHTLVAHLFTMQVATGEDVEAGTVLGTVGDSGSLKGSFLYFEIREHGHPIDPRPWLRPF